MKNSSLVRDHALDIIKFVAIAAMIIDHARFIFPSLSMLLVTIGRASFPFFAICIAYNANRLIESANTESFNKYLKHLSVFALISEVPHMLLFWGETATRTHNSILTLLIGVVFIMLYEYDTHQTKIKYMTMVILSVILACIEHRLEYGLPGVALVCALYAMAKADELSHKVLLLVVSTLIAIGMNLRYLDKTIVYYGLFNMYTVPFMAVITLSLFFAFALMHFAKIEKSYCKTGKWMYWIYPVHMMIFAVMNRLINY